MPQTLAFIIAVVTLSRMVSKLSIQWGVDLAYLFVVGTIAYLIVCARTKTPICNDVINAILSFYLLAEISVYVFLKILINMGPSLSRRGFWCCCTEHLRLIDWNSNCVIYSRYNDGSGD